MSETRTKHLGPLEIKSEDRGEVEAVVCSLNVVDHDHEVVLPGAIKDGARVKLSSFGHSAVFGDAPVGKGVVYVTEDRAILKANFFLSTTRGREAFETVKAMGADSEWSIGFVPTKFGEMTKEWKEMGAERLLAAIDLFECSPVLRGASPFTSTIGVKEAVKEGVKEAAEEVAARAQAEAAEAEAATKAAEEEAARVEAEAARLEREAAAVAEAQALLDEAAAAAQAEAEAREAEAKQRQEMIRSKARQEEDREVYERVQRTLRKLRL